ncbi:YceI family protein [Arenimonas sp.]|uniref:YceI family protein n=1 Tax=Arenimonas sp. TaxID=1872635 RepID=UPI0039E611DB
MKRLLLAAALFAGFAGAAQAAKYEIDARHTQVLFTYNHFGYSNITGRFTEVSGTFDFDAKDPTKSSIDVQLPISSVSTGVVKMDEHLRSADMFDEAKFPTASFKSTKVTSAGGNKLKVAGDLTIHGVTRPVVFDVTINSTAPKRDTPAAGFDATTTIKRSDFDVKFMLPGVPDEIKLNITMEAKAASEAPAAK